MRSTHGRASMLLAGLLLLLGLTAVHAASSGGYQIEWWVIAGGGGASSGGTYTADATIGQTRAGTISGGMYTLAEGYWLGGASSSPITLDKRGYFPLIQHN